MKVLLITITFLVKKISFYDNSGGGAGNLL